jgi:MFS family permease
VANAAMPQKSLLRSYPSGLTGLVPLFIVAHFSFHLIGGMIQPLLPAIRNEFVLDYTQAGFLLGAFKLTTGLINLPAGWLADRLGPRLLITVAIAGTGLAGLLIGVAQSYTMLVFFFILLAVLGGGYHVSAPPLIAATTNPQKRGAALGLHMIGGTGSLFIAPLAAVGIAALWGWRGPYLAISMPVLLFGLMFYVLLGRRLAAGKSGTAEKAGENSAAPENADNHAAAGGLKYGPLLPFLVLSVLSGAILMIPVSFLPLLLADKYGASEIAIGVFVSLVALGGLIASPLVGYLSDRFGTERVMIGMLLMSAPLIILLNNASYGVYFAIILLGIGMVIVARIPIAESFLIANTPARYRSRLLGIFYFGSAEMSGILTPLAGNLIDRFGFFATFNMAAAAVLVVVVACSCWLWRTIRRLPAGSRSACGTPGEIPK